MYSDLLKIVPDNYIKFNEPMKSHTSFKIGGPADVLIEPNEIDLIIKVINWAKAREIPVFVFGLGTNLLVKDKGIRGIAIKLGNNLNKITVNDTQIEAEAGARLSVLAKQALYHSLTGLEFAEGIPGSFGGAIVMNAGAYDGEMKDVLQNVTAISPEGEFKEFSLEEMQLGYRQSIFQTNGYYVLQGTIKLQKGNQEEIRTKMQGFAQSRREKQPLEFPNAGSTFKRPTGYYVGPLLQELGLKGFTIGGAQVSTKHAGFIINTGSATAQDVLDLISYIQEKVLDRYGVVLEPELKIVGE